MPIYHLTLWFNGYAVYEVEARDEEGARELFYGGGGELIEEEHTDGGLHEIECITDENDIEHHIQRD